MISPSKENEYYEEDDDEEEDKCAIRDGKKLGIRGGVKPEEVEKARLLEHALFRNPNRFVGEKKRARNARIRQVRAGFRARANNTLK